MLLGAWLDALGELVGHVGGFYSGVDSRPVNFEITEQTRQAIDEYLKLVRKNPDNYLFTGRRGNDGNLTTRQYARLVATEISPWIII